MAHQPCQQVLSYLLADPLPFCHGSDSPLPKVGGADGLFEVDAILKNEGGNSVSDSALLKGGAIRLQEDPAAVAFVFGGEWPTFLDKDLQELKQIQGHGDGGRSIHLPLMGCDQCDPSAVLFVPLG